MNSIMLLNLLRIEQNISKRTNEQLITTVATYFNNFLSPQGIVPVTRVQLIIRILPQVFIRINSRLRYR